jgi:hypothetical protein
VRRFFSTRSVNTNPEYPQNRKQGAQVDVGCDPNDPTKTRFGSGLGSVASASQIDSRPIAVSSAATSSAAASAPRFCSQCGAKRTATGLFCAECGHKF